MNNYKQRSSPTDFLAVGSLAVVIWFIALLFFLSGCATSAPTKNQKDIQEAATCQGDEIMISQVICPTKETGTNYCRLLFNDGSDFYVPHDTLKASEYVVGDKICLRN